jgi:hypothetical protein
MNCREHGKIVINQLLRICSRNIETGCQSEGRYAVKDSEIGGLCMAALIGRDFRHILMIDFGGRNGMNVIVISECGNHGLVFCEIRHKAQFDLRIVGRQKQMPFI